MYNLIRFYNQNRKQIIRIILIIAFFIGIIQLFNLLSKNNSVKNSNINENNFENISNNHSAVLSEKSLISGEDISSTKLKNDTDIIVKFIKFCNEKNIESAYDLITEDCKKIMFPSIEDFYNIYYLNVFKGESKNYTIENWIGDTYQVRYTGDILSSGKIDDEPTIQDYISIYLEEGTEKLNLNSYIGKKQKNTKTSFKDIDIIVESIDVYMDYEIYNLSINNNSDNDILLDSLENVDTIYLLDQNNIKYYSYNAELLSNNLYIKSKFKNNVQIKFANSYSSNNKIKNLIFSRMILNYEEYENLEEKSEYEFYKYGVDVY